MPLHTRLDDSGGSLNGLPVDASSISPTAKQLLFLTLASLAITLSLSPHAQARGPVVLTDGQEEYRLGSHLDVLEDPSRKLTIEEVTSPEYLSKFEPNQAKDLNPGLVDAAYWLRFRVSDQTSTAGDWWLEIGNLDRLESTIFYPRLDGRPGFEMKQLLGERGTFDVEETYHQYPTFRLHLAPHLEQTIYLRVDGQRLVFPVTLYSSVGFLRESQKDIVIIGLFLGIMLVMAVYNFFLFLALRDKSYLDYALFLVFVLSVVALRRTHSHQVLITHAMATLMLLFLLQFASRFLMVKTHAPVLGRVLKGLQIGLGATVPLYIVSDGAASFTLIWFVLVLSGLAVVFISSLAVWWRGYRPARYFLLAQTVFLGSFFVALLALLGLAPAVLGEFVALAGASSAVVLMSFALADRIHIIRKEREFAEAETVQRNRELLLLNQVTAVTATALELEAVLGAVCGELGRAFGLTSAAAILMEQNGSIATVAADYRTEARSSILGQSFAIEGDPLLGEIITHKAPLVLREAQNDPRTPSIRGHLHLQDSVELLLFPLVVENDIIGCFVLGSNRPDRFSTNALALVQSVAEQMAGAIVRIRLAENQQKLEIHYYQAQKMEAVGNLAGGVAHDFNNLLVPIMGYAELAMETISADSPLKLNLESIHKAAGKAAALTQQILAFSRKQVLEVKSVDLNEIVTEFHKMLRRLIGEDIELKMRLASSLRPAQADRSQIEQILLNLIVNARDAMPHGGSVVIETDNVFLDEEYAEGHADVIPGFYVMVAVSDSGSGMDNDTKRRIFDPFFTTKEQGKGTGLGLATVHGIVKQHGGHIWVYSEPDKGTIFKIYLPRADEPVEPEAPIWEDAPRAGTETVLVVEDEEWVRGLVCRTLASHGYKVLEAENPEKGLDLLSAYSEGIDLLLTDVIMPGMNGGELSHRVRAICPGVKVLYMSGYTEDVIVRDGVLIGGTNYLQKPFSIRGLTQKVRTILDE